MKRPHDRTVALIVEDGSIGAEPAGLVFLGYHETTFLKLTRVTCEMKVGQGTACVMVV